MSVRGATVLGIGANLITSIAGFLIDNAPGLIVAATTLITTLVGGIGDALPTLIPAAVSMVAQIVTSLIEALPARKSEALPVRSCVWAGSDVCRHCEAVCTVAEGAA